MKCPTCEVIELTPTDRAGVEIDYCPACRGVWLDRGELDKIIDRAAVFAEPRNADRPTPAWADRTRDRDDDDDDDDRRKRKRRGGFLGELFDF